MPRLRHLIIWLLILWLPAQALAGQIRLCPHAAEPQQIQSPADHTHHRHEHHADHPAPSGHEHHGCPHCQQQHANTDSLVENTASATGLCDLCLCCQLGGGHAAISPIMTSMPRFQDHWIAPPAASVHSHISHPLQRPPQSAA